MKCIHCFANTTYKERSTNGGVCIGCRHPFAFEPRRNKGNIWSRYEYDQDTVGRAHYGISDKRFEAILKAVSGDGSLFFTERQLWYAFNQDLWKRSFRWNLTGEWIAAMVISLIVGILLSAFLSTAWFLLLPPVVYVGGRIWSRWTGGDKATQLRRPKVDQEDFQRDYLRRWIRVHGRPAKLLLPAAEAAQAPLGGEPDLALYGFDRALVTDSAEVAAMLVANSVHMENACAIMSLDGYPQGSFDTIMAMARRSPQLKVFALHGASPRGCAMALSLRREGWFPQASTSIIDLGLRPQVVNRMKDPLVQRVEVVGQAESGALAQAQKAGLVTQEERFWLEEHAMELVALRPAHLIKAIHRGIARATQLDAPQGAEGDMVGAWILASGPESDIYSADSFG